MTLRDNEGERDYELYGLVEHSGPRKSGHYVSILSKFGEWWKCNDSEVTKLECGLGEYLERTYVPGGVTVPVMVMYTDITQREVATFSNAMRQVFAYLRSSSTEIRTN